MIDPVGDCKLIPDATGLTIVLPGKLHVLSPELAIKNSPMALIDVEGDFVAQVKVAGEVMPGRTPVEKMPFAFHGAGSLLWKDKDNYVRLERAGAGASGHPHTHQILVEVCKDGKPAGHNYVDWPPGPTYLRLETAQGRPALLAQRRRRVVDRGQGVGVPLPRQGQRRSLGVEHLQETLPGAVRGVHPGRASGRDRRAGDTLSRSGDAADDGRWGEIGADSPRLRDRSRISLR